MSLVGTRPPTVDEWDKYELHHRARLATKPGLTGMWQVSGRSNITDFEEVVKLDKQYISEWTMGLDIKILFKTVQVVFKKEGSIQQCYSIFYKLCIFVYDSICIWNVLWILSKSFKQSDILVRFLCSRLLKLHFQNQIIESSSGVTLKINRLSMLPRNTVASD